jgi:hypothetical protein
MIPLSDNIQEPALPDSTLISFDSEITISGNKTQDYQPLLYNIAAGFGFMDSETMDLVQQVCSSINAYCADLQDDTSLKIRLSKQMVHKCIFKISSQLFSQNMNTEKIAVKDMPLSCRSVFILHDIIGFDECEIAEMLNTDLLQVKKRLNKALLFINNHH